MSFSNTLFQLTPTLCISFFQREQQEAGSSINNFYTLHFSQTTLIWYTANLLEHKGVGYLTIIFVGMAPFGGLFHYTGK